MNAIDIHNLSKKYPKVKRYREILFHPFSRDYIEALTDISLEVGKGNTVGLLGPNGAGKTTLIKILATLVSPTTGSITVNGYDIVEKSNEVRRSIGFVTADERSFYWRLTGRQNLSFFAVLNDIPATELNARIESVLDHTELREAGDTMFKDYSTGMKQRLAIARGLLCRPDILLLDEPTRSLDPYSAQKLRTFITQDIIEKLNTTTIIATHNLHEAYDLCSHIAVMKKGSIIAHGEKEAVFRDTYTDSYEVTLSQSSPDIPFEDIPLITSHHRLDETGRTYSVVTDDIEAVLRSLFEKGVSITGCRKQQLSLDDFFILLVKNHGT